MTDDEDRCRALCERIRAYCIHHHITQTYPPVTEEDIRATEERLGFTLPMILRMLWSQVANGGEIFGNYSGYVYAGTKGGRAPRIDRLVCHSGWHLHDRIVEALRDHPGRYVECDALPDQIIRLADRGEWEMIVLDSVTGTIFEANDGRWRDLEDGESCQLTSLSYRAECLKDWLEHELGARRLSNGPYQPLRREMVDVSGLTDPQQVFLGLYWFGPEWDEDEPAAEESEWKDEPR